MIIRIVSVALIVSLVTGCASTRQFQFQSEPPGATVNISGSTCKTPCFIGISNKEQLAEISLQTGQKEIIRIEAAPLEHTIFVDFRKPEAKPGSNLKPEMTFDQFATLSYPNSVLKYSIKQSRKYQLEYR